jgi:hypothetical protein
MDYDNLLDWYRLGRLTVDDKNSIVSQTSALLSVDEYRILSGVFMIFLKLPRWAEN